MKHFNLKTFLLKQKLEPEEVAQILFPDSKWPIHAVKRAIRGEMELKVSQLENLAIALGLEITELYEGKWKATAGKGLFFNFENGDFKAILDRSTWVTYLYKHDKAVHQTVIHNGAISLNDYLDKLEELTKQY